MNTIISIKCLKKKLHTYNKAEFMCSMKQVYHTKFYMDMCL